MGFDEWFVEIITALQGGGKRPLLKVLVLDQNSAPECAQPDHHWGRGFSGGEKLALGPDGETSGEKYPLDFHGARKVQQVGGGWVELCRRGIFGCPGWHSGHKDFSEQTALPRGFNPLKKKLRCNGAPLTPVSHVV